MRGSRARGNYPPQPQWNRGPAPMASVEDLSVASFEVSPEDNVQAESGVMESNTRRLAVNYQRLLSRLGDSGEEREILQTRRDQSVTFSYRESYSGQEILQPSEGLESNERIRQVYVRRSSERSTGNGAPASGIESSNAYTRYHFRMIDASASDLRDPTDRTRRYSSASSIIGPDEPSPGERTKRIGSVGSGSTLRSGAGSPSGKMAIETSFCGPKPIPSQSFDTEKPIAPSSRPGTRRSSSAAGSDSGSPLDPEDNRNLIEEINRRMQFPLTKQDSYANAIYSGVRKGVVRKQGSYEAAVESGLNAQAAIKRNRELIKMRKQDSYAKAIGESFEESVSSSTSLKPRDSGGEESRSPLKMRKQESYLKAVGEISPDSDGAVTFPTSPRSPRVRKQDSYQRAVCPSSTEDELTPLPVRTKGIRKQDSYQRAVQAGSSLSFSESFDRNSRVIQEESSESGSPRKLIRKQDSYMKAISGDEDDLVEVHERPSPRPSEPLSLKKRQNSYLHAVGVSPEEEETPKTSQKSETRSWKKRQESYQRAIDLSPPEAEANHATKETFAKPRRQDSYLQAISGIGFGAPSDTTSYNSYESLSNAELKDRKSKWISTRQDSYQKAIEEPMFEPESSTSELHETERVYRQSNERYHVGQRRIRRIDTESLSSSSEDMFAFSRYNRSDSFNSRGYDAVTETFLTKREIEAQKRDSESDMPDLTCKDVQKAAVKIQSVYRGFQTRKKCQMSSAADAAIAARKIQRAYRKFQSRKQIQNKKLEERQDSLPDLTDKNVAQAAVRIQSVYRGFQTRRQMQSTLEVAKAALTIQRGYRRFLRRKVQKEQLTQSELAELRKASVKIQSLYRGYRTRKEFKSTHDTARAALTIQRAYKKFKKRRQTQKPSETEDLPDIKDKEVIEATKKIQGAFRGMQKRRQRMDETAVSAMKIQAAYRGFKTRKEYNMKKSKGREDSNDLPDLNDDGVMKAAIKIQAAYRGFHQRKDFATTVQLTQSARKIQTAYRHFKRRQKGSSKPIGNKVKDEEYVTKAAVKIQSVYRGFQTRRQLKSAEEVAKSALVIQKAYRKFKQKKIERGAIDDLPDLNDREVGDAAQKIQAVYRGFQARKEVERVKKEETSAAVRIQSGYRGFKARKELEDSKCENVRIGHQPEDFSDLNEPEVEHAALRIQSLYRGYQARKQFCAASEAVQAAVKIQTAYRAFKGKPKSEKKNEDEMPDLNDREVAMAALKIQSVYRGFQERKKYRDTREVAGAAMKIQKAFRKFREKREKEELENAALRIQSVYRGFKTRTTMGNVVQLSTSVAQASGGFKQKAGLIEEEEEKAAIRIQSTFRGFQERQKAREMANVAKAAVQIQSAYRGFQARKNLPSDGKPDASRIKKEPRLPFVVDERARRKPLQFRKTDLPNECLTEDKQGELLRHPGDIVAAAITIQRFFRRLKEKNRLKKKRELAKLRKMKRKAKGATAASSSSSSSSSSAESADETTSSASSKMSKSTSSTESRSEARRNSSSYSSSESEEEHKSVSADSSDYESEDRGKSKEHELDEAAKVIQKNLKAYSEKKRAKEGRAAAKIQAQFKGYRTRKGLRDGKLLGQEVAKALDISGEESVEHKHRKPPQTPACSIDFDNVAPTNTGLTDRETAENQTFGVHLPVKSPLPARSTKLKEVPIPTVPPTISKPNEGESIAQSALGIIRQSSLGSFFKQQKETEEEPRGEPPKVPVPSSAGVSVLQSVTRLAKSTAESDAPKEEKKKGGFFSTLLRRGDKKKKEEEAEPKLKAELERQQQQIAQSQVVRDTAVADRRSATSSNVGDDDLIHQVMSAVEENWLSQAPQPTLDKTKALLREDDLSESERDGSEGIFYSKERDGVEKEVTDETAAVLDKQDFGGEEFPFLETTLPQERPGIISITPSHRRVVECKLASIKRPRSASPRNPATISDYAGDQEPHQEVVPVVIEKIKVKLPKQDSISRPKPRPESWDTFSSKGLQTFKSSELFSVRAPPPPPPKRHQPTPQPQSLPPASLTHWVNCETSESSVPPVLTTFGTRPVQQRSTGPASLPATLETRGRKQRN